MTEKIGIVCPSAKCRHFNYVFDYDGPLVLLDIQRAGEDRTLPTACESCGAALPSAGDVLRPERERAEVARKTARIKREAAERAWGGGGR